MGFAAQPRAPAQTRSVHRGRPKSHPGGLCPVDWKLGHRTAPTPTVSFPGGLAASPAGSGEEQCSQNRESLLSPLGHGAWRTERNMVWLSEEDMGWSPCPGFRSQPCHLLAALDLSEPSVRHTNRIYRGFHVTALGKVEIYASESLFLREESSREVPEVERAHLPSTAAPPNPPHATV